MFAVAAAFFAGGCRRSVLAFERLGNTVATPEEVKEDRAFNRSMMFKLFVVAAAMFGFGFALVPMYRAICSITGINNLVQRDVGVREAKNTQVDMSRTISIEFDANARGPLKFKPEQNSLDVHPGEVTTVMYDVTNEQGRTVQAQAIPSYAPKQADRVFQEDRVLLLHAADVEAQRDATHAGGVRRRSEGCRKT